MTAPLSKGYSIKSHLVVVIKGRSQLPSALCTVWRSSPGTVLLLAASPMEGHKEAGREGGLQVFILGHLSGALTVVLPS